MSEAAKEMLEASQERLENADNTKLIQRLNMCDSDM